MGWIRIEAGEYWSQDDRFHPCDSMKHCKYIAENIIGGNNHGKENE